LKDALGIDAAMETGRTASFEVVNDGKLLFSKLETGRFPTNEEIIGLIKA